jgi:hypothetical protein
VLSLPLGSMTGVQDFVPGAPSGLIRATIRSLVTDMEQKAQEVELPRAAPPVEPQPRAAVEAPGPATGSPAPARETQSGLVPISQEYFEAKQLTEIPRPLSEPPLAELERIVSRAGKVRMVLFIDETGKVTGIDVQSATLPQEVVLRAAEIFSEVRFSPGRIGPIAVKSRIGITVGAALAERSYAN